MILLLLHHQGQFCELNRLAERRRRRSSNGATTILVLVGYYTVLRTKIEPRDFLSETTKTPKPRELSSKLRFNFFAEGNKSYRLVNNPLQDDFRDQGK